MEARQTMAGATKMFLQNSHISFWEISPLTSFKGQN
jgi:hypothetical protein